MEVSAAVTGWSRRWASPALTEEWFLAAAELTRCMWAGRGAERHQRGGGVFDRRYLTAGHAGEALHSDGGERHYATDGGTYRPRLDVGCWACAQRRSGDRRLPSPGTTATTSHGPLLAGLPRPLSDAVGGRARVCGGHPPPAGGGRPLPGRLHLLEEHRPMPADDSWQRPCSSRAGGILRAPTILPDVLTQRRFRTCTGWSRPTFVRLRPRTSSALCSSTSPIALMGTWLRAAATTFVPS